MSDLMQKTRSIAFDLMQKTKKGIADLMHNS